MSDLNFKNKYEALKVKFMDAVDVSFRLGYEAGAQQAQQQASADQAAQQQAQSMQAGGGQPQQLGQPVGPQGGVASEPPNGQEQPQPQQEPSEDPNSGSELDAHIGQLEQMVAKGDFSQMDLMKALSDLKAIKPVKADKYAAPMILSHQANKNLSVDQKQAITDQHKIVADVMNSFKEEAIRANNDVRAVLAREGLFKSED